MNKSFLSGISAHPTSTFVINVNNFFLRSKKWNRCYHVIYIGVYTNIPKNPTKVGHHLENENRFITIHYDGIKAVVNNFKVSSCVQVFFECIILRARSHTSGAGWWQGAKWRRNITDQSNVLWFGPWRVERDRDSTLDSVIVCWLPPSRHQRLSFPSTSCQRRR